MSTELIDEFLDFYKSYMHEDILELAKGYPKDGKTLVIDWDEDLYRFDPDLADDFLAAPDEIREYAELALAEYPLPIDVDMDGANVRLENIGYDSYQFDVGGYSTDHLDNLIPIQGQINKITQKKMVVEHGSYECLLCGTITRTAGYQEPHECQGCERQGPFELVTSQSELTDHQMLRLQLPPEKSNGQSNEHIDLTLKGELVNCASPGDRVEVAARLDAEEEDEEKGVFDFCGEVDSIKTRETDFEDIETEPYEEEFKEIAAEDPYQALVDSIAPSIHGYDVEKLAIALQMFGGTKKELPDGSVERGDSHILLVGDPGVGKSDLLEYANKMAPRSVFTDGKGSTTAGLTASAVRDDFGGNQWTIEGGSLVKAHKGLACVDELDDMDEEDRAALNTALEKQEIPVSKAGITTTLPARTTLLAAANPKLGRFDQYDPIPEQINLDPTLISRFDLIFTIQDQNDAETDQDIIEHKATTARVGQKIANNQTPEADELENVDPEIDREVMRAYVAYAKQHVTPVMTDSAYQMLVEEFASIRQSNKSNDEDTDKEGQTVPVTFRKQEALIRLSEASARARLSEEVTEDDVERALMLVKRSLQDVGIDPETGDLDADMIETGQSNSQHKRVQWVLTMVDELDDPTSAGCPHDKLLGVATSTDWTKMQIEGTIDNLLQKGEIYESKENHYVTT